LDKAAGAEADFLRSVENAVGIRFSGDARLIE
jgi:hypothetical protein